MTSDDPAQLLALSAEGDRAAFGRLYELTAAKLLGVIRRIVSDPAEADDVLQDVYVRLWAAAPSFDATRGPALAWMATSARNRAIDRVRLVAHKRTSSTEVSKESEQVERHPGELLGDRAELQRCLGDLSEEPRTCVLLAYVEGWSREELAERYGRPVGTIKSWLSRALSALKACLEAEPVR